MSRLLKEIAGMKEALASGQHPPMNEWEKSQALKHLEEMELQTMVQLDEIVELVQQLVACILIDESDEVTDVRSFERGFVAGFQTSAGSTDGWLAVIHALMENPNAGDVVQMMLNKQAILSDAVMTVLNAKEEDQATLVGGFIGGKDV